MTDRMTRARALYLAVYESQGGQWEANDCKELWCDKADRYLELCGSPAQTLLDPDDESLFNIADWLEQKGAGGSAKIVRGAALAQRGRRHEGR